MASPPCVFEGVRIHCDECNRHFRIQTCFGNHNKSTAKKKSVCHLKRICATCGITVTQKNHECSKRFCVNCFQKREVGHFCYMRPLMNVLQAGYKILYVFYVFESTQNARYSDRATLHVPNPVCLQQFCSR